MNVSEKKLRMALKANALFSLMSGVMLFIFSKYISELMNIADQSVFLIVGSGLLLFSTYLLFNAYKREVDRLQIKIIIIQDWLWVIGSIAIIIFDPFQISSTGQWIIGIVAIVVTTLAIVQAKALQKT